MSCGEPTNLVSFYGFPDNVSILETELKRKDEEIKEQSELITRLERTILKQAKIIFEQRDKIND